MNPEMAFSQIVAQAPILGLGLSIIWVMHRQAVSELRATARLLVVVAREFRAVRRSMDANTRAHHGAIATGDEDSDLDLLASDLGA